MTVLRTLLVRAAGPALLCASALAAQPPATPADPVLTAVPSADTATVVINPAYEAGPLKSRLLGVDYRSLWTTPVRLPVLDLDRFAGGLQPVRTGGSQQTRSLRLVAEDGRQFNFRSVDKFPQVSRTPDLADTPLGRLIDDQTSALLPGAAVTVPPMLEAIGVIHAVPLLVVMPDDARLGEFRAEFAGMVGTIEAHPDEGEDGELRFAGSERIIGSDRLQERILESPDDRVESRSLLRARLLDVLINDWDRHWGQWRWAEFERDGVRYWHPIPEDRDYAYANYDGWLASLARTAVPNILSFGEEFAGLQTLSFNAYPMDRRLLAELPREAWDSAAVAVQAGVSDEVLARAIGRLPEAFRARVGADLERTLRARRERLPDFARRWYAWLSTEVDVHGTDEAEFARVDYHPDGSAEVRLYRADDVEDEADADDATPFFRRRFLPAETREVRVYLHGDDDRAVARGEVVGGAVAVRLVGGAGDDVLADSTAGRARVSLHDDEGENRFLARRATSVDTVSFEAPEFRDPVTKQEYRDFGATRGVAGTLRYGGTDGVVLGAGATWTRYGFRRVPYAWRTSLLGSYSFRLKGFELELHADRRRASSNRGASLHALASQIQSFHFYGYGNDTPGGEHPDYYLVDQDRVLLHPTFDIHLAPTARASLGPVLKYSDRQPRAVELTQPGAYGSGGFGQLGAAAEAELDLRDSPLLPRGGVHLRVAGAGYPATWDVAEPFGTVHTEIAAYFTPVGGARTPTLALRAGSRQVWGRAPLHEAAFLGGWQDLRGYPSQRFAGDAAVWAGAELRSFLTRAKLFVRGDLGVIGFSDAGRVFVEGESPGGWHTSSGGGLYFLFRVQDQPVIGSALYAHGDEGRLRLQLGFPF